MAELLPKGTRVEVRNSFDQSWSAGFEVVGHDGGRYAIMRCSDRTVLPRTFGLDEVRRTRKSASMWWV
jgi:hypothetical protein